MTRRSLIERDEPAGYDGPLLETAISELEYTFATDHSRLNSRLWKLSRFDLTVWMATPTQILEVGMYSDGPPQRVRRWNEVHRHTVTRHAPFNAQTGLGMNQISNCAKSVLHTLVALTEDELISARKIVNDWPIIIRHGVAMVLGFPSANGNVALENHRLKLHFERVEPLKNRTRTA